MKVSIDKMCIISRKISFNFNYHHLHDGDGGGATDDDDDHHGIHLILSM